MNDRHWMHMTIEEFCELKLLDGTPDRECVSCGEIGPFYTDDMGEILCIDCSHNYYSYLMHSDYDLSHPLTDTWINVSYSKK